MNSLILQKKNFYLNLNRLFDCVYTLIKSKYLMYKGILTRCKSIEFFSIPPNIYKNANIANFVLVMPFKIKKTNKVCNLER